MLKLYNTLTRKKEVFKPIKKGKVRMYVCGPTVNGVPHLGHARSQVSFDILRRFLLFSKNKVKFISNITDIEDKIINEANKQGLDIKEFSAKNEKQHMEDYTKLNILKPDQQPHATEYVNQMIELVKKLEKKGYTYLIEKDGVYFNVPQFKEYGKLSHQNIEDLQSGKRIQNSKKKSPQDFVLWKLAKPGEPSWDSPWGEGRPGWHIECSTMTKEILGLPFDIHGGGADLIFPHHEDEIAQTEAGYGKKMANFWVHNGMVNINGEKMSKSLGNFKTIRDLFKNYSPMVIRYLVASTHYRKPLDFSKQALEDAKNSYERLKRLIENLIDDKKINKECLAKFTESLDDDLNTPKALAVLHELVRDKEAKGKVQTIKKMDEVLALDLLKKEKTEVPKEVQELAEERQKAREDKDYKKSDDIRDKLHKLGWQVNDTSDGFDLEKI
jgi:cysteinyl-tRNA synthetase